MNTILMDNEKGMGRDIFFFPEEMYIIRTSLSPTYESFLGSLSLNDISHGHEANTFAA